jgi:hypothetical protein
MIFGFMRAFGDGAFLITLMKYLVTPRGSTGYPQTGHAI